MNSTQAKGVNSTHAEDAGSLTGASLTGVAACCALGNAVLRTLLVPGHLAEKFYIGVLFAVGSAIMLAVAAGLVFMRRTAAAWLTGALVSLGMIVGFALSRTLGLPYGYHEAGWEVPYGPLSLLVEGLFVLVFLVRPGTGTAPPRTLDELRDVALRQVDADATAPPRRSRSTSCTPWSSAWWYAPSRYGPRPGRPAWTGSRSSGATTAPMSTPCSPSTPWRRRRHTRGLPVDV